MAFPLGGALALIVADGAGGMSGGAEAAEAFVQRIAAYAAAQPESLVEIEWADVLSQLDQEIADAPTAGETTAVVAIIQDGQVFGASIGDSDAVLIAGTGWQQLTVGQIRKPLCGSGCAVPVAFGPASLVGTLLVGSDGLFKYARPERIGNALLLSSLDEAAQALIDAARLPTGGLQDDISVLLCRAL